VAEGNDALMEEFFDKGTIAEEDLVPALHNAIRDDKLFPVIFGSGLGNIGADRVMDFIVDYTPAPPNMSGFKERSVHPAMGNRHGA
jgi:elongation factor G